MIRANGRDTNRGRLGHSIDPNSAAQRNPTNQELMGAGGRPDDDLVDVDLGGLSDCECDGVGDR